MSKMKKFLKLTADFAGLQSRRGGIIAEADQLRASIDPAEAEALRLEILGDNMAPEKKNELKDRRSRLRALEEERDEVSKKIRICQELLPELRAGAASDLWDEFRKPYEQEILMFIANIKEALASEKALVIMRERIRNEYQKIDAPCPFEDWEPLFRRGPGREHIAREWELFIERMRGQGFAV